MLLAENFPRWLEVAIDFFPLTVLRLILLVACGVAGVIRLVRLILRRQVQYRTEQARRRIEMIGQLNELMKDRA